MTMETMNDKTVKKQRGFVSLLKRFVRHFWEDRFGYAAMFLVAIIAAPAILTTTGFAVAIWSEHPWPCLFTFIVLLWSIGEWNVRRKKRDNIDTFYKSARYMFEVAKHLDEVGRDSRVICSNDKFELHIRQKDIDA